MEFMHSKFIKKFIKYLKEYFLFNSINKFFNYFILSFIFVFCFHIFRWLIFESKWPVISSNLSLFAFGNFPNDQQWRPFLWIISLLLVTFLTILSEKWKIIRETLGILWLSTVPLGMLLLYGGVGLTPILSRNLGGLTLTIFLTLCSLLLALPLGIILAFCRQCSFIVIKKLSAIYIDSMRSIPLITVLFFGQLLIPLFLPFGIEIDRVWRAIFAFTMFVSAYIAEDIRGGLQSIPYSQIEAAKSLGFNQFQIIRFILVPQSLHIALPCLTNQSIGLFQNTSLMSIFGLLELLGIGRSILANPKFIGQYIEVYIWLAFVYWLVCTIMALIARNLEKGLKVMQ
tara:strand:- start:3549 stop:4574 length:1026 start_codon:yes stop_codon:yes gene_type:complete